MNTLDLKFKQNCEDPENFGTYRYHYNYRLKFIDNGIDNGVKTDYLIGLDKMDLYTNNTFDIAQRSKEMYIAKYNKTSCETEKKKLKSLIHSCQRYIDYDLKLDKPRNRKLKKKNDNKKTPDDFELV